MIYLDAAATTAVRREVLEAMWPYLTGDFGNPSSHHEIGNRASVALEKARATVARYVGARPTEIVFTGGGTEADNLAIKGVSLATPRARHIVTSPIEHPAVLESCDYLRRHHAFQIDYVPVDHTGMVDLDALADLVTPSSTLVSIMMANNEIGTVQPIGAISKICRAVGVPLHSDAVQAVGSLPIHVRDLGLDALSLSGHKLGAPKGIGALYVRGRVQLEPVLHGGGQERGARSGTENVAAAVGLATALGLASPAVADLFEVRDVFIDGVLQSVPGAVLTGHRTSRLAGNASFCFPGTSGESVLLRLEESGIVCSSGSACAAGSDEPSHVLTAVGIEREVAQTAVRFTFGADFSREQAEFVVRALREAITTLAPAHP
ncbi:cysteine desulfurase [Antricoccus suffuscus]|uniref:cysteine desulfurase n=1 Tax=Antricoccus suffuscus TaxID=1629062 RepID=A0A2T0ZVZ2_9ACTN|nr:cysteine desulfurase family protein [Antricoccus suffuscus]PRZ40493.1 cysteine desulfurase [Antricoccus suffuscus]